MKQKPKSLGMVGVMLIMGMLLPSIGMAAASAAEARIPFILPTLKADKMPQVFFSHDRHVERLEKANKDCTVCHDDGPKGMSEYFLKSESKTAKTVVAYVHSECVRCHAATPAPTGPALASCRSCHDSRIAASQAKTTPAK